MEALPTFCPDAAPLCCHALVGSLGYNALNAARTGLHVSVFLVRSRREHRDSKSHLVFHDEEHSFAAVDTNRDFALGWLEHSNAYCALADVCSGGAHYIRSGVRWFVLAGCSSDSGIDCYLQTSVGRRIQP